MPSWSLKNELARLMVETEKKRREMSYHVKLWLL